MKWDNEAIITKWCGTNKFHPALVNRGFFLKESFSYEEKELFIALTLMQEDEKFHVGESVYAINGGNGALAANGKIGMYIDKPKNKPDNYNGQIFEASHFLIDTGNAIWGLAEDFHIRKATYEEICAHYRKQNLFKAVDKFMEKEFVLPEFWCIRRTPDTAEAINAWMNAHHKNISSWQKYEDASGIVNNKNLRKIRNEDNLPELTFEQFLKYVLKQEEMKKYSIAELSKYNYKVESNYVCHITSEKKYNEIKRIFPTMSEWDEEYNYYLLPRPGLCKKPYYITIEPEQIEMKKVIGYKAPYQINASIYKDTLYVNDARGDYYCPEGKERTGSQWYLPKEIVEQWEAVYEQKKIEMSIPHSTGALNIVIEIKGRVTVVGEGEISIPALRQFLSSTISTNIQLLTHKATIQLGADAKINVGCKKGILLKDIENVIKEHDKMFGI